MSINMADSMGPICVRKVLQHSNFVLCQCCKRKVHKNCTEFTQDEFQNAKTSGNWFCRLCNESIFAFNHIDDDYEFVFTLCKFMKATCKSYDSDVQMGEKIFDPFEINDIDSNIIDYQGGIDPDKNYFNQLSHHLSKSSNYHTEESFNKFILRNNLDKDNLSMIHVNIRSVPANLTGLLSYKSDIEKQFAVIGLTETWLTPFNIETYGINGYNHVGLTRKKQQKWWCIFIYNWWFFIFRTWWNQHGWRLHRMSFCKI